MERSSPLGLIVPRAIVGWIALSAIGCTPATPAFPAITKSDAAVAAGGSRCPAGYSLCEQRCCASGTTCVAGSCQYPYSTAHLYVYLCPSFNQGCNASFFTLDQTCSPIKSAQPGTCYDTGFEVASN